MALDKSKEDIQYESNSEGSSLMFACRSDCQWLKLDMPSASNAMGHSMSPFGCLDAELGIPRSGNLSEDDSHPLSHDIPSGVQPM